MAKKGCKRHKKYPKKPKVGASVQTLENWLKKKTEIDKYNKTCDAYNKKLESLNNKVKNS